MLQFFNASFYCWAIEIICCQTKSLKLWILVLTKIGYIDFKLPRATYEHQRRILWLEMAISYLFGVFLLHIHRYSPPTSETGSSFTDVLPISIPLHILFVDCIVRQFQIEISQRLLENEIKKS